MAVYRERGKGMGPQLLLPTATALALQVFSHVQTRTVQGLSQQRCIL